MHHLIPFFIYEQYRSGKLDGRLRAVTLFLDISGFSAMTQTLIQHGRDGAETLAHMINQVFEPIIGAIYAHGGFVILFAGDGLTVVFPHDDVETAVSGCHAAQAIAQIFIDQPIQSTRLGDFVLTIRQGLSVGEVEWGIIESETRKTYFFRGEAITGCAHAEHQAAGGDIVLDNQLLALLPPATITCQPLAGPYARLTHLNTAVSPAVDLTYLDQWRDTAVAALIAARFFPPALWQMPQQAELRYAVTLFVSFAGANDFYTLNYFIARVMNICDRFGGFFVETDFGDKGDFFLVYFGAPVAHENDVKRALDFVLALKTELPDHTFTWRAGLTAGLVYAGYVGTAVRDKYTCMGSTVNLAARLMMHAQWGEVLVSREVAIHPAFDFASLGKSTFKGFAQPVPVYQLLGNTAAERVFPQKLVGREPELRQMLAFAQPLLANRQVGIVRIFGDAGIGKSHLVYTFSQLLGARVRWLSGQTDPILREPLNPFIYILKRYFGQTNGASEANNKANFIRRFDDLLTTLAQMPDTRALQNELTRTKSFLGALLGLHWPDSLYERLTAQGRYRNTFIAITTLLQAECLQQPVVLKLEDVQLLDDASKEFLLFLTQQAAASPLLLVFTSRYLDNGQPPAYVMAPNTPELSIGLQPLPASALQDMTHDVLGMATDNRLQRLLVEKSEANPFFVQQILYFLQENNLVQKEIIDGQPVATLTAYAVDLPPTLTRLLVARLDRLPPSVKEVVQTAAVLGREFDSRLLSLILQRDLSEELKVAEQEQIWTVLNALTYIFKHGLLRDAAYEMQLRAHLRPLHYLAAVYGEQLYALNSPIYYGTLAYHYEAAFLMGQTEAHHKAVHYLQAAGQQALKNFEHQVAIHYFNRALALTPVTDLTGQFHLLLARETAHDMQGNREAQAGDLEDLAGLSRQLALTDQVIVVLRQANYSEAIGNYELASRQAETAVTLAQQTGNQNLVAEGFGIWGVALWRLGRLSSAQAQFQVSARLAKESANLKLVAHCLHGLGNIAYFQRDHVVARNYYQQALAIRQEIGDRYGEELSLNNLGVVALSQGDTMAAQTYHAQTLSFCREIGDRRGEGTSFSNLGHVAMDRGDHAAAKLHFEQSLAIRREVGDSYGEAISLNELGAVTMIQGNLTLAEAYYRQALTIRLGLNQPHHLVEDWAGLARLKLAQNDPEAAWQYGQQVLEHLRVNPGLEGAIDPLRTFHFMWVVLRELARREAAYWVLQLAAQIMQAYLDKNPDPRLQAMYLRQPRHSVLWAGWQDFRDAS
ncbi:MAG: tetratricopeptide repeat protein [Chloroflexi bacterium]|nr:tetratricopeptide repeat protein [Chloroflexota bacterium]MBP7042587.1 tetratricopeptide repeat protein [Chloroflexota bacterium]